MLSRRQTGFGIVELMIGLTVGLIVVGAALALLSTTIRNSNDNIKMARLENELRQAMQMISRDLRRATSWEAAADVVRVSAVIPLTLSSAAVGSGVTVSTSATNSTGVDHLADIGSKAEKGTLVFVDGSGNKHTATIDSYSSNTYSVTIGTAWPTSVTATDGVAAGTWNIFRPESTITVDSGNCIIFVYDTYVDGVYGTDDRFGYKLNTTDNAIDVRYSAVRTDTCTSGGSWENLTDKHLVVIDTFSIEASPSSASSAGLTVGIREYTITITGHLKADSSITRTLRETVRVRNDTVS